MPEFPRLDTFHSVGGRAIKGCTRSSADSSELSQRFIQSYAVSTIPAAVFGSMRSPTGASVDENQYLCHPRTMYRILHSQREVRERRNQLRHPKFARPELLATAPNQVWTWDVTWLRGPTKYVWYPLYIIIDLFSRFNPGWMLAHKETGDLAAKLIRSTCERQGIKPGTLTSHADRGPVPKGKTLKQLYIDLEIVGSFSRPRVSNDNPYSEAQNRTMKYGPTYPDRFDSFEHARAFCREFFAWYNNEHRHSGIAFLTPSDVHHGRADERIANRKRVMTDAFARNANRFVTGQPRVPALPRAVWINPPENRAEIGLGLL